jgi:4-amino-4-deoxy-L-arabinose transferase-like glycosyltransferase
LGRGADSPDAPASSTRSRRALAAVAAAAALLLFYRLGAKDFWDASEARPAESAREMRLQGDRLLPYTNGLPDLTKPPVYAWLASASFAVLGESEGAARLPSALLAIGVLVLTWRLGARIGGPRAGALAAFSLLTQARFLWQARLAELETALALAVLGAYAAFFRAFEAERTRERLGWGAVAWACVGLGFATKGPIALLLVLPGAIAAAAWTRRASRLAATAAALPLAALLGLPWYVAVVARDPSHLDTFLSYARGENVGHLRDPFYYLVQYPLNALPWTPLVAVGLALPFGARLEPVARDRARLAFAAFATTFLLLCAIPAKQTHYLIPVFPFGAVLAGVATDRLLARAASTPGRRRAAGAAAAALVAVLAVGVGHVVPRLDRERSARGFFEEVARTSRGAPLAWTVFGSHSDYLWYLGAERVGTAGVPELVGPTRADTVERVRAFLAGEGRRHAVVFGEEADALGDDAVVLLRDDAFQRKRRKVALVAPAEERSP